MSSRYWWVVGLLLAVLMLTACDGASSSITPTAAEEVMETEATGDVTPEPVPIETEMIATEEPTSSPTEDVAPEETPSEGDEPVTEATEDVILDPQAPRRLEFESEDGTMLVGTFYPPDVDNAAGVVLMHQYGSNKEAWEPLIDALLEARPDLALLAIDFPGHGESGGERTNESILAAARTSLIEIGQQPQVDPSRIVLIGASIGADAAVDACLEGCVGAVSISPGDWLGVPYVDALEALDKNVNPGVLCMASEGDAPSPETCHNGEEVGLSDYMVAIYDGDRHGNSLAAATWVTPEPVPIDLIIEWLGVRLPLQS